MSMMVFAVTDVSRAEQNRKEGRKKRVSLPLSLPLSLTPCKSTSLCLPLAPSVSLSLFSPSLISTDYNRQDKIKSDLRGNDFVHPHTIFFADFEQ